MSVKLLEKTIEEVSELASELDNLAYRLNDKLDTLLVIQADYESISELMPCVDEEEE